MDKKITQDEKDVYLAQWMEGEITDAQLKSYLSEVDYVAFKKIKEGVEVYAQIEKPLDVTFKGIQQKIQEKSLKKNRAKSRSLYIKIAFAVAASVVLFFGLNQYLFPSEIKCQSNFGEVQYTTLLDGSEVVLNAKSQLRYDTKDWEKNREVFLEGEAFFKVKKGSTFAVKTANGKVTVLGTHFNVNSNKGFFEVICYEGKVQVVSHDKKQIITRNQSVRATNVQVFKENLSLKDISPSWINGESSFRSVPLSQVITALEKQFGIQINAKDIDDRIVFTGSFDHKNLQIALASVFETFGIKYKIENKTVQLSN